MVLAATVNAHRQSVSHCPSSLCRHEYFDSLYRHAVKFIHYADSIGGAGRRFDKDSGDNGHPIALR
jgi:hypothetical protein